MNAEHLNLFYYTRVCWLSKGNVLARVFELREELQEFLNRQGKYELESFPEDNTFISQLSYLVDIFGQLNCLNLKMLRKDTTVVDFMDALNAFVQKLDNCKRKVEMENFAMFEALSSVVDGNLDQNFSSAILAHLTNLKKEFLTYFSEISNVDLELVRKPFAIPLKRFVMIYKMNFLISEVTLVAKTCLTVYQSVSFGQGYVFRTHMWQRYA